MIQNNSCLIDKKSVKICTEEYDFCKEHILKLALPMRLVQVSYIKAEHKLIFYFIAPQRVDFRELLKILRRKYQGYQIELRQIGNREATALIGGMGICGRILCCGSFLKEFSPVTAKMAKNIDGSPNPARHCGFCGRLRCCLRYEF